MLGTRFVMNGKWLIQCELCVGNLLLMEFLSACGPDSKSLHRLALCGSDLNEAGTGVLFHLFWKRTVYTSLGQVPRQLPVRVW